MNMAKYGSRWSQQPENVNFEPIIRGLKSDFWLRPNVKSDSYMEISIAKENKWDKKWMEICDNKGGGDLTPNWSSMSILCYFFPGVTLIRTSQTKRTKQKLCSIELKQIIIFYYGPKCWEGNLVWCEHKWCRGSSFAVMSLNVLFTKIECSEEHKENLSFEEHKENISF